MKYKNIVCGKFLSRPNRFIAHVLIDDREEVVHVKNTGRCRELLLDGTTVYLEKSDNPLRKTKYDLIAVEKAGIGIINMDSQAPNKVALEWINSPDFLGELPDGAEISFVKPEYTFGNSRFDLYLEYKVKGSDSQKLHKMFIEVKGCTLEEDGIARFPDAPTERGVKHLTELSKLAAEKEYECGVLFVVQMKKIQWFEANRKTHPQFADALKNAESSGVKIFVRDCKVDSDSLVIDKKIPYKLI